MRCDRSVGERNHCGETSAIADSLSPQSTYTNVYIYICIHKIMNREWDCEDLRAFTEVLREKRYTNEELKKLNEVLNRIGSRHAKCVDVFLIWLTSATILTAILFFIGYASSGTIIFMTTILPLMTMAYFSARYGMVRRFHDWIQVNLYMEGTNGKTKE